MALFALLCLYQEVCLCSCLYLLRVCVVMFAFECLWCLWSSRSQVCFVRRSQVCFVRRSRVCFVRRSRVFHESRSRVCVES